ncbi:hypothetical protein [Streptomyces gibsoniae]|uniref:Uncharacterized protein n=1 Tax=Streptomyces gibsoniae TaxID=3075529 RepID=A0ABU2TWZ5_9ACTN|nr:hypothetical protein [Streptomyces sp. DSM 41699]MDT0465346.1 hypothetical protein [Streptomyces sp. DSM 41699]
MLSGSTNQFEVSFTFRAGWCRLTLRVGAEAAVYRATSIEDDFFSDLVEAVARIASGRIVASVLWGDEPGGVFLDIARSGPDHASIAVHQLGLPDWLTPADPPWAPVRGNALVMARIPVVKFLTAFAEAFSAVQESAPEGRIPGWGGNFPAASFAALRREMDKRHSS